MNVFLIFFKPPLSSLERKAGLIKFFNEVWFQTRDIHLICLCWSLDYISNPVCLCGVLGKKILVLKKVIIWFLNKLCCYIMLQISILIPILLSTSMCFKGFPCSFSADHMLISPRYILVLFKAMFNLLFDFTKGYIEWLFLFLCLWNLRFNHLCFAFTLLLLHLY
jgi:hypothetical protein